MAGPLDVATAGGGFWGSGSLVGAAVGAGLLLAGVWLLDPAEQYIDVVMGMA